jgi:hypothetical protein
VVVNPPLQKQGKDNLATISWKLSGKEKIVELRLEKAVEVMSRLLQHFSQPKSRPERYLRRPSSDGLNTCQLSTVLIDFG